MKRIITSCLILQLCLLNLEAQNATSFDVRVTGAGPDLLLIPGAACSGEVWKETVSSLKADFTCHVVTLAGYAGVAPLQDPPYLDTYLTDLSKYIKQLNGKPIVMGHSIGGWLALKLGMTPDLLEKVIVIDALPFLPAANDSTMTEEKVRAFSVEPMVAQYEQMSDSLFRSMQLLTIKSMVGDSTKHNKVLNWSMKSDRKTMAYTVNEMMREDLRGDLKQINVPVLVLGAWDSDYPQTRQIQKSIYTEQFQNAANLQLIMAHQAKHFIMIDDLDWMIGEVRNFLK